MKIWQDIYTTIENDANIRGAVCTGLGEMCVLGGLASDAGLDVEGRYQEWSSTKPAKIFVDTNEAIDFIIEHYPLTKDDCVELFRVNDEYKTTPARRRGLIKTVERFEARAKERN